MKLNYKIEELLYKNSSDLEVAKSIKKYINEYLNSLNEIFETDQGKSFLVKHTKNIDSIIKTVFKYTLRTFFREYIPLSNSLPITLAALGSYGREQLCVYSDIDLMIVYEKVDGYNIEEIIQKFIQILWDSGIKLGHRTHTIDELFKVTKSDHTIKSAILEARYISGSKYLWIKVENQIQKIQNFEQKKFILEKLQEYKDRKKRYPFCMEPNIKSSPGGLRDFNTIYWIAKSLYNIDKIKNLDEKIINEQEHTTLLKSVEFLYRVRSALHLSTNKKEDTLFMEYLPSVAKKLNMSDIKVAHDTFEAMHNIRNISRLIIKRLTKQILFNPKNISLLKKGYKEKNFIFYQEKLYSSLQPKSDSLNVIVKKILNYIDKDIKFDISFINYLSISKNDFNSPTLIKTLFEKEYIYHILFAFYNANLLSTIIPPLAKVQYLAQFDGYHRYPVDIHSLRSLKALENIENIDIKNIFNSLCIKDKSILRFATLLHDCGKGRKQDHSILGANIAKNFALEIGYDKDDADIIYTLIKNHTRMSNTAHREDIYSDKVIFNFLSYIQTKRVLDLLYILTYADINSVSKKAFNNFNSKVLEELYQISKEAIENKNAIDEAIKREKKEKEIKKLPLFQKFPKLLQKKILSIDSTLLFFKYKAQEIVNISQWINSLKSDYDYKIDNSMNLTIEIIRKKDFNLGYFLSKLSKYNVRSMDIFKFFNGIKYFKIEFSDIILEEIDIILIEKIIKNSFDMSKKTKLYPLQIKRDELKIDCSHSRSYASFKINTIDQKGLLANIMTIFDDIKIDIASAKIQTIKNRTRNLLLLEKNGNFCKNQERIIKKLCAE